MDTYVKDLQPRILISTALRYRKFWIMKFKEGDKVYFTDDLGQTGVGKIHRIYNHVIWVDWPEDKNNYRTCKSNNVLLISSKKKSHLPEWL